MNTAAKQQKGFTIIEVVLVLAIAALIFLMVFIALPALQANQRDTARKNDASTVAAAVQSFVSNERRAMTASNDDVSKLVGYFDDGLDQYDVVENNDNGTIGVYTGTPSGSLTGSMAPSQDNIHIFLGNKCNGTELADGVARSAAVFIQLEGSGNSLYCVDV